MTSQEEIEIDMETKKTPNNERLLRKSQSTMKKWIPKKPAGIYSTHTQAVGHNVNNPRSLAHNKTKSFSEGVNASKPTFAERPKYPGSFTSNNRTIVSPSSSPTSSQFHLPQHRTTRTTTTTTTQYIAVPASPRTREPLTRHKRSASDPFKDDFLVPLPATKVVTKTKTTSTSTSTSPSPLSQPNLEMQREIDDMHKVRKDRSASPKSGKRSNKRSVTLVDAATQTVTDAATQTEIDLEEDILIQAAQLLIRSVREKKEKKMRISVKSMSFNGPTELPPPTERMETSTPPENDILSDLNDLEEEIAMMRFKAMSLQEQMKWLNQEKVSRPKAPLGDIEFSKSPMPKLSPLVTPKASPVNLSPANVIECSHPLPRKPSPTTIEFTDSKPMVDRCCSPVSILPIKVPQDFTRTLLASPDHSKRTEISNAKSSAFSGAATYLNKTSRLTKSLSSLPELL